MIETIFSGLIVAAITGITILAYKHPEAYKMIKLPSAIFKSGCIFLIVVLTWNFALTKAFEKLLPFVVEDKVVEASKTLSNITMPIYQILFVTSIVAIAWLYSLMLLGLPLIIGKREKRD